MSPSEPEAGAAGVDFVVGDPSGLSDDYSRQRPTPSSARRGVVLAGVAVAGALLVARVVTTHSVHHPAASRPGAADSSVFSVSPAAEFPMSSRVSMPVTLDSRTGMVVNCPDFQACTVVRAVPRGVANAVRASFPGARVAQVVTVLGLRDGTAVQNVLERTVTASAGTTHVTIELHGAAPSDGVARSGTSRNGHNVVSLYADRVPGYAVSVEAHRPSTSQLVALQTLAVLANRPGLLSQ